MWILVWEDHIPLQVQPVCLVSIFWQVGGLVLLYSACCWRDVWLPCCYSSHLVVTVSAFYFRSKNYDCRIIREILSRHKDWLLHQLSFRHEMKKIQYTVNSSMQESLEMGYNKRGLPDPIDMRSALLGLWI